MDSQRQLKYQKKEEILEKQLPGARYFREEVRVYNGQNTVLCPICLEYKYNLYSFFSCEHLFCLDCCLTHLRQNLHQRTLPKCLNGCEKFIERNTQKILEKLTSSEKDRYSEIINQNILQEANLKICPNCPNKEGILVSRQDLKEGTLYCIKCERKICSICLHLEHPGECQKQIQYMICLLNNQKFSKCPNCQSLIQKTYGCNHMTCKCKKQFCFQCEEDWEVNHIFSSRYTRKSIRVYNLKYQKMSPEQKTQLNERMKERQRLLNIEITQIRRLNNKKTLNQKYLETIYNNFQNYSQKNCLISSLWKILLFLCMIIVSIALICIILPFSLLHFIIMWIFMPLIMCYHQLDKFHSNQEICPYIISVFQMFFLLVYFYLFFFVQVFVFEDFIHQIRCIWCGQIPYYCRSMHKIFNRNQYPTLYNKFLKIYLL